VCIVKPTIKQRKEEMNKNGLKDNRKKGPRESAFQPVNKNPWSDPTAVPLFTFSQPAVLSENKPKTTSDPYL
jgi:hypothetical protein